MLPSSGTIHVASLEDAMKLVSQHEIDNCVRFVRRNGGFRTMSSPAGKKELRSKRLGYQNGIALMKYGSIALKCQHGGDYNPNLREKRRAKRCGDDGPPSKLLRRSPQDSYKCNCPAKIMLSRQILFHHYQRGVSMRNVKVHREKVQANVRSALEDNGVPLQIQERFILVLPEPTDHQGHPVGKDNPGYQPMDEQLKERIREIVTQQYITDTKQIQTHLVDFVRDTMFKDNTPPAHTNQRFFPKEKSVRNFVEKLLSNSQYNESDQDSLEKFLTSLPSNNMWKLRKYTEGGESLLLVHQNLEQQELLNLYGSEICLLDSSFKTAKYTTPMFFVVIPINTGYRVVATFLISEVTIETISEAIAVLKQWNPDWQPAYWMSDCCTTEIAALEKHFPDSPVLMCDFQRLQAWNCQLRKLPNDTSEKDGHVLKAHLCNMADSTSLNAFDFSREELEASREWRGNDSFRNYINQTWFHGDMYKRWVRCYRSQNELRSFKSDKGMEALNNAVKGIIKGTSKSTLYVMFERVVQWLEGRDSNRLTTGKKKPTKRLRKYVGDVPLCLQGQPEDFVNHVMNRFMAARELIDKPERYNVLITANGASCSCKDFHQHSYPCKHILKHWLDDEGDLDIPSSVIRNFCSETLEVTRKKICTSLHQLEKWTYTTTSPQDIDYLHKQLLAIKDNLLAHIDNEETANAIDMNFSCAITI